MAYKRECDWCGKVFYADREHARFDKAACRVAWNRAHAGDRPVTRNTTVDGDDWREFTEESADLREQRAMLVSQIDMVGAASVVAIYLGGVFEACDETLGDALTYKQDGPHRHYRFTVDPTPEQVLAVVDDLMWYTTQLRMIAEIAYDDDRRIGSALEVAGVTTEDLIAELRRRVTAMSYDEAHDLLSEGWIPHFGSTGFPPAARVTEIPITPYDDEDDEQ
jgi:hypothetical protein